MAIQKENVLANIGGTFKPINEICRRMAKNMQRTITVTEVKRLLFQLVDEGLVETYLRERQTPLQKSITGIITSIGVRNQNAKR